MDATERRVKIAGMITAASAPLTGGELAARMGVTRQIVVQDVALLRAGGAPIVATPSGYLYLEPAAPRRPVRVFSCRHEMLSDARRELMILVQGGGTVRDVIVEHPVYGEIAGSLMLRTPEAVEDLIARLGLPGAGMLSSVTGGVHMHTVEARSEAVLDALEARLKEAGILA